MSSLESKAAAVVPAAPLAPLAPPTPLTQSAPGAPRALARSTAVAERLFYGGAAACIGACIVAGFWRSYLLRGVVDAPFFPVSPLSPRIHLHGGVFFGWILLFIVQTALVGAGRRELHRKLGLVVTVWVPLLVAVGVWTSLHSPPLPFMEARAWLGVTATDLVVFAALAIAGFRARRDLQTHKRLMLLATICLLPPAVGRWPLPQAAYVVGVPASFFALADLAIVPLIAWDLISRGRIHRATLWGGLAIVLSLPLRYAVVGTATWLAIADGAFALVR